MLEVQPPQDLYLTPKWWLFTCVVLLAQVPVYAAPDAGSLQPRTGTESRVPSPAVTPQTTIEPPSARESESQTRVTVTNFQLDGELLITQAQFSQAVAPYLNRSIGYDDLLAAAQAVAVAYRQAGWVVSAVLPEQDISEGTVRIQVNKAIFGGVDVTGWEAARTSPDVVQRYIATQQAPSTALRADSLERALLLINDLPGVGATGMLRAGQHPGEANILVELSPAQDARTDFSLDNTGSRYTGEQRAQLNWSKPGVLTWGDQLSANLIHTFTPYQSDGSDYQQLSYSFPLGYSGWRMALGGSVFSYRLVSPEFSGLGFYGDSDAWDLELTYPLVRSPKQSLYLVARVEQMHFDNQGAGVTVSRYRLEEQSWGLFGKMSGDLGAGASSAGSLIVSSGLLDLRDSPTQSADANTTATNGAFTRLRYSLSHSQGLGQGFSALAVINGQTADKNLDSSAKFYLGGSNGVRAYPTSEGSGYQGFVLNLEARWKPAPDWQLAALYDYGYVTVNHDNNCSGASSLNEYALKGYGLSAAWRGQRNQTLALTWARRIGDNANATSAGNDQDGTYYRDRFWLTATMAF